jgi:hypothetical protein
MRPGPGALPHHVGRDPASRFFSAPPRATDSGPRIKPGVTKGKGARDAEAVTGVNPVTSDGLAGSDPPAGLRRLSPKPGGAYAPAVLGLAAAAYAASLFRLCFLRSCGSR